MVVEFACTVGEIVSVMILCAVGFDRSPALVFSVRTAGGDGRGSASSTITGGLLLGGLLLQLTG